jgi:hypothetical protein
MRHRFTTRDGRPLSEEEALDDNGCIRDGVVMHTSLLMRDALSPLQRSVAQSALRVTDSEGGTAGLHRPGWRIAAHDVRTRKIKHYDPEGRSVGYSEEEEEEAEERKTSDAMTARDAAYRDYERDLTTAYLGDAERGKRPGDPCSKDGKPGSLRMIEGALECVLHNDSADSADHYAAYDAELSEEWRRGP